MSRAPRAAGHGGCLVRARIPGVGSQCRGPRSATPIERYADPMFEDRTYKTNLLQRTSIGDVAGRRVSRARPDGPDVYLLMRAADEPMDRPALTLCLLVFALTFPGPNRFRDKLLNAAVDIASSWVTLIAILALCAYATRSFHYFENDILLAWVLITPVLQLLAVWIGRRHAALSREPAGIAPAGGGGRRRRPRRQGGARADREPRTRRRLRRLLRRSHRRAAAPGRDLEASSAG